jgi:hypothetical protein
MTPPLFCSLDSAAIVERIRAATFSICYASPGIQIEPAKVEAVGRVNGPNLITVCLDFDERVMRMGFGEVAAVKHLRDAGIAVKSTPGLRTGLLIVDNLGYIFTPTALYLEAEDRPTDAPNAMRLSKGQVTEALARLSLEAKAIAIALAKTDQEKQYIKEQAIEVPSAKVTDEEFATVNGRLEKAPPVKFDVARQVRVFTAYLQYVELKLTGAAIQRHRLSIPASIQRLGGSKDIEGRLRTTFDLIEKGGPLSSEALEEMLTDIRNNLTRSLGKDHGRVVLKAAKPHFEQRIAAFKDELKVHQEKIEKELQAHLDDTRKQVVNYFLPRVVASPPDAMRGQFLKFEEADARAWLDGELDRVLPMAETLIQKMQLEVRYKDVTFETLNGKDFLDAVKVAFPNLDWDKAYEDFRAAGRRLDPGQVLLVFVTRVS